MRSFLHLCTLLAVYVPILAAPSKALEPRGASQCGQYTGISTRTFTIAANEGGASEGSGSQCSQINSLSGSSLAWQTTWTWANNPNNVKSYTNLESSTTSCKQLSAYKTIPTTWSWGYDVLATGPGMTATKWSPLLAIQARLSELMSLMTHSLAPPVQVPRPNPTATPTIGNIVFDLIVGMNGATTVYSFVAQTNATSYSGDLLAFFMDLGTNENLPYADYLQSIQAESEVFTGSGAELLTTAYTISSS